MTPGPVVRLRRRPSRMRSGLPDATRWERGPPPPARQSGAAVTLATPAQAAAVVGAGQWRYRYSAAGRGRHHREWADPAAGYPET